MTTQPLVSIGIPTFNRAHLIKDALTSALSQSYSNIEIMISDNASVDNTAEVVESLRTKKVSYHRNETNVGASRNWESLLERASGEYFAWLQDDDMIFPQFIEGAVRALEKHPNASAYIAYAAVTQDPQFMFSPWLYGPPVRLDWANSEYEVFSGDFVTPISLFLSFAIPPVIVYRTSALRECVGEFLNDRCALYAERVGISRISMDRSIIIAPRVCGIFRDHAEQHSKWMLKSRRMTSAHRLVASQRLNEMWGNRELNNCPQYLEFLRGIPNKSVARYYDEIQRWNDSSLLNRCVTESLRTELLRRGYSQHFVGKFRTLARQSARECKAIASDWRKQSVAMMKEFRDQFRAFAFDSRKQVRLNQ